MASKKKQAKPHRSGAPGFRVAPPGVVGPDPDARILAKVQKLLALAADDGASEEERRTAAVTAAKLMRTHGIAVGGSAPCSSASSSPRRAVVPAFDAAEAQRVFDEHATNARDLVGALFGGAKSTSTGGLFEIVRRTAAAVERDVERIRKSG